MATGDVPDMAWRVFRTLPDRWFPALEDAPVLRAILFGIGQAWSFVFDLVTYARQQARISTATGPFLDMISEDFFGLEQRRWLQETDQHFADRLRANLLREKATRAGVLAAVSSLTQAPVSVFEPGRPADTGGYGGIAQPGIGGGFGYGAAGLAYGSLNLPFQFLILVHRPAEWADLSELGGYAGLDDPAALRASGGYGIGALEYLGATLIGNVVTDDQIRQTIIQSIPVNAIAWLALM